MVPENVLSLRPDPSKLIGSNIFIHTKGLSVDHESFVPLAIPVSVIVAHDRRASPENNV
jgi:hypothetical protein